MRRRDFLKVLAATSLGAFGVPSFAVREVFGKTTTTKKPLKDAIEELVNDSERLVYLLGAAYAQTGPDLRLTAAALTYYLYLDGNLVQLVRAARALRYEDEPRKLFAAIHSAMLGVNGERIYGVPLLTIEGEIIASVWIGVSPAEMLEMRNGGVGQHILDTYVKHHGSTIELLEMADAEVEVPDGIPEGAKEGRE